MFKSDRQSKTLKLIAEQAMRTHNLQDVKVHYSLSEQEREAVKPKVKPEAFGNKWHVGNKNKHIEIEPPEIRIHKKQIDPFRIERNFDHMNPIEEMTRKQVERIQEATELHYLVKLVEKWSTDKNLHEAESSKQMLKVIEEVGEVAAALARNDQHELKDGIGDVIVTLIILAQQNGTDIQTCLAQAYEEIAERKGKMVNGVFVKEENL